MQDMMKNLMGEMWKGVGSMNNTNWMKDIKLMEDMDPTKIGLQMLDFQKNTFNNVYSKMLLIQEQTEKMVEPLLKNTPVVPEEWGNILKKNQEDLKKAVDESFVKAESYLSSAGSAIKKEKSPEAETSTAKTAPGAK